MSQALGEVRAGPKATGAAAAPAEAAPGLSKRGRRAVLAAALGCVLVAVYTGSRMPSAWAATLQTVGLQDGFRRRFAVGTLTGPVLDVTGHRYELLAVLSYLVLAALLAVLVREAVTTAQPARRLLVFAFLLLPTGGYLVHEVGYFDQVLYLLLFGALRLLGKGRWTAAALLMAAAMCVHEIAALTVLPVFVLACARCLPPVRALAAALPAAAAGLFVLAAPPTPPAASADLQRSLAAEGFPVRPDALDLFARTQMDSWRLYSPADVLLFLLPLALFAAAALILAARCGPRRDRPLLLGLSLGAALAPVLAAFAGWDKERWAFLLIANFFLVLWLRTGDLRIGAGLGIGSPQVAVVAVALLLTVHVPLKYFDDFKPRPLTGPGIGKFWVDVSSGHFFATPRR
ncbi:hypothetical protein [Yinghuangia soli]|uniref:Uncharacterized protein n=1 Tax=Yinghuangia soli TaxID=2908204 RepID=A0AA41TZK6_9ACTN|nr:hypothetical protein [Yinghuangia soli]MCF2527385.1 hypothetical protein [Yinghuangia soli]